MSALDYLAYLNLQYSVTINPFKKPTPLVVVFIALLLYCFIAFFIYSTSKNLTPINGTFEGNPNFMGNIRCFKNIFFSILALGLSVEVLGAPGVPSIWAPSSNTSGYYSVSWSAGSGDAPDSFVVIGEGLSGGVYSGSATSSSRGPLGNGTYYYRVKACLKGVCSGFSSVVSTRVVRQYPPGTPSISSPSTSSNGYYSVNWWAGSGPSPSHYEVIGENISGYVYTGSGTSSSRGGLVDGTYYYRVRACNSVGCSGYSATTSTTVSIPKIPNVPSINSPHISETGYFTVNWHSSGGPSATRYEVIGEGLSGAISNNMSVSSSRGPLVNGTYYYRVKACNAYGCSALSPTTATTVKLPALPGKPTLTVPPLSENGSYQVLWQPNGQGGDPTTYQLVGENQSDYIYEGSATSLQRTNIAEGDHYYKVRGCNVTGCGEFSEIKGAKIRLPIQLPVYIKAQQEGRNVVVSWEKVDAAVSYSLQVKYNSADWQHYKVVKQQDASEISYQIYNLTDAVRSFRVSVCTAYHCSDTFTASSNVIVINPPSKPMIELPSASSTGDYTIHWSSQSGTKPITYQLIGEQKDNFLYEGEGYSLVRNNMSENDYYYRVKACNSIGCSESAVSSINVRLPLALPSFIKAEQQENNIIVSWEKSQFASDYLLQVKFNSGSWQDLTKVTPLEGESFVTYQLIGLLDGWRAFRVAPCSAIRCLSVFTPASNSVRVENSIPNTPSKPVATTIADTVTVNWPRVPWASYYKAKVQFNTSTPLDFTGNKVPQVSLTEQTVSLQLVGVNAGIRVFTVQACNIYDECSAYSVPSKQSIVQPSKPDIPKKPSSTVIGNDIIVKWPQAPYAVAYNVQVKFGSGAWTLIERGENIVQPYLESEASVTFNDLASGSRQFRVQSINNLGKSAYSEPSDLSVLFIAESNGQKLTWQQAPSATSYVIETAVCLTACNDLEALSWTWLASVPAGSTHYAVSPKQGAIYKIKACYSNNTCSKWNYVVEVQPIKRVIFIHSDLLGSPVAETTSD